MYSPREIMEAFFSAMKAGYVSGENLAVPVNQFPWSKMTEWRGENIRVIDFWQTGRDGVSGFGTTTICSIHAPINPLWMMQYYGKYPEIVYSFLKEALRVEYDKPLDVHVYGSPSLFCGCRGPRVFVKDGLLYINHVDRMSSFSRFSGEEEIFDSVTRRSVGFHKYHGMMMLP